MKKIISVLLLCVMLCTLCACGNPCAKGHSYVASEAGCKCERCEEVIEHSLTQTEDGCLCEVCGELKAHTFIAQDDHCVCEVCGFATGEHEFESELGKFVCANCSEEVSKMDFLCDYILENGDDYPTGKSISYTVNSTKNEIACNETTECLVLNFAPQLDKMGITSIAFSNDSSGKYDETAYVVLFKPAIHSLTVIGSQNLSEYEKGMELKNPIVTGDDNSIVMAGEESAKFLAAYYIEQCLYGAQAVLDHYHLDITLADLGFVNFK